MATNPKTLQEGQKLAVDALIELYDIDLTPVNGGIVRITPKPLKGTDENDAEVGKPVVWRGETYVPVPMQAEGWEARASGTSPTPSVTLANVNAAFSELNASYDDLRGMKFTRWRVYRKFLDGMPDADPDEHYPPDIYRFEQKTKQNLLIVSFDMSSALDQQDVKVPGRQILRQCQFRYRDWNPLTSSFVYNELITCQYDGEGLFDAQGNLVTDPAADVCGHNFDDCVLRMGENAGDIFGGFPGAGAIQGS